MAMDRFLGEAYILMRADGTLIPRDVREVGKKAAKGYTKEFDKELKAAEKGSVARFRRTLAQATVDIDFSAFRKEFGSVDATVDGVKQRLKELNQEGGLTEKQLARISNEAQKWASAQRVAARETERTSQSTKRLNQFFKDQTTALDNITRARAEQAREVARASREEEAAIQRSNKAYESYGRSILVASDAHKAQVVQQKQLKQFFMDQEAGLKRITAAQREQQRRIEASNRAYSTYGVNILATIERDKRAVRDYSQIIRDLDRDVDIFAIGFGRAFGKGSRNNFLNWVGSLVQGLITLTVALPTKAIGLFIGSITKMTTAFSQANGAGMGIMASSGRALAAVFGGPQGLVTAILAVAGGLIVFGKVLPAIVSLLSLLAGAATALVGAFSIGIVGALLALIPVLGAAVAGFGILGVAMFQSVKDNKKVKESFKGITDDIKKFAREIGPELETMAALTGRGFRVLFADMKVGIRGFLRDFAAAMTDPSTTAGLDAISESFGRMFVSIGKAVSSFGSGLVGFFQPVLPYAERLARYIADMAARFDAWANSPTGRNEIANFMDVAWVAGKRVYSILTTIGEIIGKVFFQGTKSAGNSFLLDIQTKLEEISAFLSTEAGKKSMSKWFEDAKQIGEDVGNIALSIGGMIRELNSPAGRENAKDLMNTLKSIAELAEKIVSVADAVGKLVGFLNIPLTGAMAKALGMNPSKPQTAGSQPVANLATPGQTKTALSSTSATKTALQKYTVKIDADDTLFQEKKKAIAGYVFGDKKISIDGNKDLWDATKGTVAADVFQPKPVPVTGQTEDWDTANLNIKRDKFPPKTVDVKGNDARWQATKGTVAGYQFQTKMVTIAANAKPAQEAIENVRRWLNSLPSSKTIRIAGVNSVGGLTMARGGILTSPTWTHPNVLAGEAGREAYVPLDRPLNQIDKSVRWLAAIAQGKPMQMASGGVTGGAGKTIIVEEGAVKVSTAATSPQAAGRVVLNSLADALAGVG